MFQQELISHVHSLNITLVSILFFGSYNQCIHIESLETLYTIPKKVENVFFWFSECSIHVILHLF
jgi:hypothetical protein